MCTYRNPVTSHIEPAMNVRLKTLWNIKTDPNTEQSAGLRIAALEPRRDLLERMAKGTFSSFMIESIRLACPRRQLWQAVIRF
jgi:hypothetical protein